MRRSIAIANLSGLTKNSQKDSTEFIIHVLNEPDYRLTCDSRKEFLNSVKLNYISVKHNNLSVFGISKSKTLSDFVTTEADVKKGKNRLPLKLARVYEEDLMSDEEVAKKLSELSLDDKSSDDALRSSDSSLFNQDTIMANLKHKQESYKRKSSYYKRPKVEDNEDTGTGAAQSLFHKDTSDATFENFKIVKLIGRGTFGKVYLVVNEINGQYYAMKSIRKDVVLEHDSLESLKVEKLILL